MQAAHLRKPKAPKIAAGTGGTSPPLLYSPRRGAPEAVPEGGRRRRPPEGPPEATPEGAPEARPEGRRRRRALVLLMFFYFWWW